jgi:hypothetical protein
MLTKYDGSCSRSLPFIILADVLFYILYNFLIGIYNHNKLPNEVPYHGNILLSAIIGSLFFLQRSCSAQNVV